MTDSSSAPTASNLYVAYENWKRWDNPFTYSVDENAYFEGECRGLVIAGAMVFEIGFGSGNFLAWAQQKGASVAGSEINPASLESASSRGIALLPAAFEDVADANAGRFDTVFSFDVFEHFTLDEIVCRLAALETMIKPGGHVLLRFPNAQSPFGLAPQNGDPTHRTALSRDVFELLVQKTEFEIVRYGGSFGIGGGGMLRGIVRPLRNLLRSTLGRFLNFVYATRIPYDPVVVIVLRRRLAEGES